ncbi:glycosyltransferase family 2 protein [Hyphococcus aureus]|uniref:Glycosyltransferase n=1 Tax=Hyphococcus aureus TaxID=2666033 RepID=A0ABW1KVB6_9PROT
MCAIILLTRLFTLEYSLWFDWLLPALQKMGAPIPLGGTSNFFRTGTLISAGGWDPYNVTEDADLGLRLARLGYRVEVIGSTTFEEANCRLGNWMRQRSRWLKGYLQTWIVHMRRPQRIIATTGWRGFLAVQLFVAGNVFSAIINPIMWSAFLFWALWRPTGLHGLLPAPLVWLNLFALLAGNLLFILTMMIGPLKRGWLNLAPYSLTAPAYWLLSSLAAYKALWQVFRRPHYWEKTDHVISEAARKRREVALAEFFDDQPPYDRRRNDIDNTFGPCRPALSKNERARQ